MAQEFPHNPCAVCPNRSGRLRLLCLVCGTLALSLRGGPQDAGQRNNPASWRGMERARSRRRLFRYRERCSSQYLRGCGGRVRRHSQLREADKTFDPALDTPDGTVTIHTQPGEEGVATPLQRGKATPPVPAHRHILCVRTRW